MNMANVCYFEGRLTKDPTIKKLTGKDNVEYSVCTINIALSRQKTKTNKDPGADYILCKALGTNADNIEKYFKKGQPIRVACSFVSYTTVDKNNQKSYGSYFKIEQWTFPLSNKNDGNYSSFNPTVSDIDAIKNSILVDEGDLPF